MASKNFGGEWDKYSILRSISGRTMKSLKKKDISMKKWVVGKTSDDK